MHTDDSITDSPGATIGDAPFDAASKMTSIQGRAYLEVKWRLVWLRDQHPDATIETELIRDDGTVAVFKARVVVPTGGSATGWGQEAYQDFGDYLEKAETKALGRALAALGYGTQFCDDHTFDSADKGRVVDSPVDFANRPRAPRGGGTSDLATEKQVKAMYAIGQANGHDVNAACLTAYGVKPDQLVRRDASTFIDMLKLPPAKPAPPTPPRPLQQAPPPEPVVEASTLPTGGRLGTKALGQWLARARAQFPAPGAVEAIARDLVGLAPEHLTIVQAREVMEAIEGVLLKMDGDGRYMLAGPVWDEMPDADDRRGEE